MSWNVKLKHKDCSFRELAFASWKGPATCQINNDKRCMEKNCPKKLKP